MRYFAICSLLFALSACKIDDDPLDTLGSLTALLTDSTTNATASGSTGGSTSDGTGTSDTPTTSMGGSDSATTSPTTGDSATTAMGSTSDATNGSTGSDTTGIDTTGNDTTGGGGGDNPYQDCSNAMGMEVACPMGSICIDSVNTGGAVKGGFCSPACSGPGMLCPTPDGAMGVGGQCLFGADPMKPTNCALICNLANDTCPAGSTCEDIGIMGQMGQMPGICTFM